MGGAGLSLLQEVDGQWRGEHLQVIDSEEAAVDGLGCVIHPSFIYLKIEPSSQNS